MSLNATNKLILAFITLVIGIVLITPTSSEILERTTLSNTYNETITIPRDAGSGDNWTNHVNQSKPLTLTNTDYTSTDCEITLTSLRMFNGTTLTLDTDYNFSSSTGVIYFLNTSLVRGDVCTDDQNSTAANYTYCGRGYLNLTWGRTLLNLVPGFIGIALLLIAVGLFYSFYSDVRSR